MILSAYLAEAGFFRWASWKVITSVSSPRFLELAGPRARIGFWRFLGYGAVVTTVTMAASLSVLLAERTLGIIE